MQINCLVKAPFLLLAAFACDALAADPPIANPTVTSYSLDGGCPSISCHARPSDTPAYGGYYVGGGAAFHGEPRGPCEGTWGWDYSGFLIHRRVALDWFHGWRSQGGTGAYKTDGPRLCP